MYFVDNRLKQGPFQVLASAGLNHEVLMTRTNALLFILVEID